MFFVFFVVVVFLGVFVLFDDLLDVVFVLIVGVFMVGLEFK